MDEGRLLYVKRVVKMRQKLCAAVNDKIRDKLRVLTESLEKNKRSTSFRRQQQTVGLKWSFTKTQGLLKCLTEDSVCDNEEDSPRTFGRYDGTRLTSYRRQVESDIAYNHPKERRRRKIEGIKNDRERYGMLSDYSKMNDRLESILERPPKYQVELDNVVKRRARRPVLRRRPVVNQRAQLRLPPITVSREVMENSTPVKSFLLETEPLPSIHASRSNTLMSF